MRLAYGRAKVVAPRQCDLLRASINLSAKSGPTRSPISTLSRRTPLKSGQLVCSVCCQRSLRSERANCATLRSSSRGHEGLRFAISVATLDCLNGPKAAGHRQASLSFHPLFCSAWRRQAQVAQYPCFDAFLACQSLSVPSSSPNPTRTDFAPLEGAYSRDD